MRYIRIIAAAISLCAAVAVPSHASPARPDGAHCEGACLTELEYAVKVAKGSTVLVNTVVRGLPGQEMAFHTAGKDNDVKMTLRPDGTDPDKVAVTATISDKATTTAVAEPLVLPLGEGRLVHAEPWILQVTRMPVNADR